MKVPTNFELLQVCSSNFLTAEIPDNFLDLDESQQYEFLNDHAWEPVEDLSPDDIWQLIESSAETMSNFLLQKCFEIPVDVKPDSPALYILTVEVDVETLTETFLESTDATEPDTVSSMIGFECNWLEPSGLHVKDISPLAAVAES